jgi:hypothetical protein
MYQCIYRLDNSGTVGTPRSYAPYGCHAKFCVLIFSTDDVVHRLNRLAVTASQEQLKGNRTHP